MASRSLSAALWPASVLYGGIVRLRAAMYHHGILRVRRLAGAVISVGNLTVGGTGKTPMVLWLAERLAAEGHRPAILTRGYRGMGSSGAGPAQADEVSLLRRRLGQHAHFGIGKDRYRTGRKLEENGTRWFILDDGFQHLALGRDVNIVLLDATDPFGGGYLLPAGRLREPKAALARADMIVITRADHAPAVEAVAARYSRAPIFYAHTELEAVVDAPEMSQVLAATDRARMKFLAFCGIGNPAAFFYDLRRWGFAVVAQHAFRDHHRYTPDELAMLDRAAAKAGADAILCTEKDVFNLPSDVKTRVPKFACRIHMALADADGFWTAVQEALQRHRTAASK